MSSMFDVDCPRTPDGDDDRGSSNQKTTGTTNNTLSKNSRPPLPPARSRSASVLSTSTPLAAARPGSGSSTTTTATTTRVMTRNAQFSPRPRGGTKRTLAKGIEPEEYIVTSAMPTSTRQGQNSVLTATHHVSPSSGSANPFDADDGEGDKYFGLGVQEKQQLYGPSRNVYPAANSTKTSEQGVKVDATNQSTRTSITGITIQQLQQQLQQHQQQGCATSNDHQSARQVTTNNYTITTTPTITAAAAATSVVDDYSFSNVFTNINLSSPGNHSPGGTSISGHNRRHHLSSENVTKRSNIGNNFLEWCGRSFHNKTEMYQPPNLDYETNLAPRGVNYTCGGATNNTSSEWVVSNCFSPNGIHDVKHDAYSHRRREVMKIGLGVMVMVVMCTIFGVTVSELKEANAALLNGGGGANVNGSGSSSSNELNGMVPLPSTDLSSTRIEPITATTLTPSASPTKVPDTLSPTKAPLSRSPVAGYYAVHIKTSDGTAWPTRSPITSRPTNKPSMLSNPATEKNTNLQTGGKRGKKGGKDCTDDADRFFLNHLSNHKNCEWLENGKSGYTDRKDKNCGGRPVEDEVTGGEIIYVTTELGLACPKTCALYNGCADEEEEEDVTVDDGVEKRLDDVDVGEEFIDTDTDSNTNTKNEKKVTKSEVKQTTSSSSSSCQDTPGKFLNHNSHLKDCVWLHNNKEGKTDRKDMNCGSTDFPVATELGLACRETCSVYNPDDDCEKGVAAVVKEEMEGVEEGDEVELEDEESDDDDDNDDENEKKEENEKGEAHSHAVTSAKEGKTVMRSYSSPMISYSLTSNNLSCTDGTGVYLDHNLTPKPCKWLEDGSKHRQSINCGSKTHGISELGMECPWSCREYNDC